MYEPLASAHLATAHSRPITAELDPAHSTAPETRGATSADENTMFTLLLQQFTPTAYITPLLLTFNILIWLAMVGMGAGIMGENTRLYLAWGANFAPLTSDGQWWRLLTSAFLHFGIIHLAFNMYALWRVGPLTERMYGNGTYLAIYLVAAISGGIASLIFYRQPVIGAGASGAIFGIYGALIGFIVRQQRGIPADLLKPLMKNTLWYIGYSLYTGFTSEGIDNAAHVGGLLGGFIVGLAYAAPLDWASRRQNSWRSLLLGSVLSIMLIGIGWRAVPAVSAETKAELGFEQVLDLLTKEEEPALQRYNTLLRQAEEYKISDADFATEIERCCQRLYQSIADRLTQVQLSQHAQRYHTYQLLTMYVQHRLRFFQLLSEGIREQNLEKIEDAQTFTRLAEKVLQQIEAQANGQTVSQGPLQTEVSSPLFIQEKSP